VERNFGLEMSDEGANADAGDGGEVATGASASDDARATQADAAVDGSATAKRAVAETTYRPFIFTWAALDQTVPLSRNARTRQKALLAKDLAVDRKQRHAPLDMVTHEIAERRLEITFEPSSVKRVISSVC
jgi:hypothetical protein